MEERGRLRSHFLMDAGDLGSRNLTVTWVDVPPGAEQRAHSHEDAEQVYVIVRGHGRMQVAGDVEEVGEGDLIFIPPATQHSIRERRLRDARLCLGGLASDCRWRSCTAPSCRPTATATTTTESVTFFDNRALTGTPVVRTVGRRGGDQQTAAGGVRGGGACDRADRRPVPEAGARPARARGQAGRRQGGARRRRRSGVRARHRGGAAPGRLPASRRGRGWTRRSGARAAPRRGPTCRA